MAGVVTLLRENGAGGTADSNDWNYHTFFAPDNCKWVIPPENNTNLLHGYCNYVATHSDIWDGNVVPPSLAERLEGAQAPVTIRFTLPFMASDAKTESSRAEDETNFYDDQFLSTLIHTCQQSLGKLFHVEDVRCYHAAVLESPRPWHRQQGSNRQVLTRVEIRFPFCQAKIGDQQRLLYDDISRTLQQNGINATLSRQPLGDWFSNLEKDLLTKPYLMYGSSDEKEIPPLRFRGIYDAIKEAKSELKPMELSVAFNPYDSALITANKFDSAVLEDEEKIDVWLPLLLSSTFVRTVIHPAKPAQEEKKVLDRHYDVKWDDDDTIYSRSEVTQDLLKMISPTRIENTNEWMDIGRALYTVFRGSDVGRQLWMSFTSKNDCRDVKTCESLYEVLGLKNYVTEKTLAWYAALDNQEEYRTWHKAKLETYFQHAASLATEDVAKACYWYFWLEYMYGPSSKPGRGQGGRGWYHFHRNKWVDGELAFEDMERDVLDKFRTKPLQDYIAKVAADAAAAAAGSQQQAFLNSTMKNLQTLQKKLGEEAYIKKVASLMRLRFSTRLDLLNIMNSNMRTMGHENGVWEVIEDNARLPNEKWLKFRPPKPEDYITMSTGIKFNPHFTWDHPRVQAVMKYKGQVFTDPEICRFEITYDASIILGGNRDKLLTMRTGRKGNNSKSLDQKLKRKVFGEYARMVSTSVLSGKKGRSGEANPEEARLTNARVVLSCESERNEEIQTGKAKELSGGDDRYVRGLYDPGREIQQTYKVTTYANHDMRVTEADTAIKNRMLIIPYDSVWSEDAPEDEEEQYKTRHFKANPEFEAKLLSYADAYAWILYKYFEEYKKTPYIVVPAAIRERTNRYWETNDIYTVFIRQKMARAQGCFIHYDEVWRAFCQWYRDCKYVNAQPDLQMVIDNLQTRLGDMVGMHWRDWRIERGAASSAPGFGGGQGMGLGIAPMPALAGPNVIH